MVGVSAKYTWSAFQHLVIEIIETADRNAPDFFIKPPIMIDCRADIETFRAIANIDAIRERNSWKPLEHTGDLRGAARTYAQEKLREHYNMLDADARKRTEEFLRDWMSERGRADHQRSKHGPGHQNCDSGIEIALPLDGLRLPYNRLSAATLI